MYEPVPLTENEINELYSRSVHEGGATFNVTTKQFVASVDEWLFPKHPELTTVVTEERLRMALAEFTAQHADKFTDDVYLGVWRGDDDRYYIDLNAHVESIEDARRLARTYSDTSDRSIISAYNPLQQKTQYFEEL